MIQRKKLTILDLRIPVLKKVTPNNILSVYEQLTESKQSSCLTCLCSHKIRKDWLHLRYLLRLCRIFFLKNKTKKYHSSISGTMYRTKIYGLELLFAKFRFSNNQAAVNHWVSYRASCCNSKFASITGAKF